MSKEERVHTNRGFINDIEANLLKLMQITFERDEVLRFYTDFRPVAWVAANPDRISDVEALPAIYTWCDGLTDGTNSIGGSSGNKLNHQTNFFCTIEYLLPLVNDYESEKVLREVSWILFENVTENMNLFGLFSGDSEILELTIYPDIKVVKDKPRKVSAVSIKLRLSKQRRSRRATI
jgi:hypothetical protein